MTCPNAAYSNLQIPDALIKPDALLESFHDGHSLSSVRLQNLTNRLLPGSDYGWKHSPDRGMNTMLHPSPAKGYNSQWGTIN